MNSKVSILVSYGHQEGRSHMAELNLRMAALDEQTPWRWQFALVTGLDGDGWGGTKVGPDLWAGSFKDFPFRAFTEAMLAAGWEDPSEVQVMVYGALDDPWRTFRLDDLSVPGWSGTQHRVAITMGPARPADSAGFGPGHLAAAYEVGRRRGRHEAGG